MTWVEPLLGRYPPLSGIVSHLSSDVPPRTTTDSTCWSTSTKMNSRILIWKERMRAWSFVDGDSDSGNLAHHVLVREQATSTNSKKSKSADSSGSSRCGRRRKDRIGNPFPKGSDYNARCDGWKTYLPDLCIQALIFVRNSRSWSKSWEKWGRSHLSVDEEQWNDDGALEKKRIHAG